MFNESKRDFMKGFDAEESRRKRQDERLGLRKKSREEHLQKRRRQLKPELNNNQENVELVGNIYLPTKLTVENEITTYTSQDIPRLFSKTMSKDFPEVYEGVKGLRQLLSMDRDPPIDKVLETGVLPKLLSLIQNNTNEQLQFEAAWTVTNIASSNEQHTGAVVHYGGIKAFVNLLSSGNIELFDQAVWGLGNIVGDSTQWRDLVLKTDALEKMLQFIEKHFNKTEILNNVVWCLSNFCRCKPIPWVSVCRIIPIFNRLLKDVNSELIYDVLWTFSYLSDDPTEDSSHNQVLIQHDIVSSVIDILRDKNKMKLHQPCLRIVGNILTGTDLQTQIVLDAGFLDVIEPVLQHQNKNVRKECCWALSNICAGTANQAQMLLNKPKLLKTITNLAIHDVNIVRREAGWCLSNSASIGNPYQIQILVESGCIVALVSLLDLTDNPQCLQMAIEGLECILKNYYLIYPNDTNNINQFANIIEECHGLEKLECIQENDQISEELFIKCGELIKNYWGEEEQEEEEEEEKKKNSR